MRSIIVFLALITMLALLAFFQVSRPKTDHPVFVSADEPAGPATPNKGTSSAGPAAHRKAKTAPRSTPPDTPGGKSAVKGKTPGSAPVEAPPKPLPPPMKRPLKIAGAGWELLAPGIVANDGLKSGKKSLFARHKLSVELTAHDSLEAIESAIARGGEDKLGADIGIMPLPAFVASYEQSNARGPRFLRGGVVPRPPWSDGEPQGLSGKTAP